MLSVCPIFIENWQVKLVDSSVISYRGTVYHYYNKTWGILCDEGWNSHSATVVCNQLGLGKAIESSTSVFHGSSTQNFLWTNTSCTGTEYFLKDCDLKNNLWEISQTCSGQHVAVVECEGIVKSTIYVRVSSRNCTLAQNTIIRKWPSKISNFEGTKVALNEMVEHLNKCAAMMHAIYIIQRIVRTF